MLKPDIANINMKVSNVCVCVRINVYMRAVHTATTLFVIYFIW